MAYTVIENFKSGMVRYATVMSLPPGSLYEASNGHITPGGEFEKRTDAAMMEKLQMTTSGGLLATNLGLYTFGSGAGYGTE